MRVIPWITGILPLAFAFTEANWAQVGASVIIGYLIGAIVREGWARTR